MKDRLDQRELGKWNSKIIELSGQRGFTLTVREMTWGAAPFYSPPASRTERETRALVFFPFCFSDC